MKIEVTFRVLTGGCFTNTLTTNAVTQTTSKYYYIITYISALFLSFTTFYRQ